MKAVEVLNLRNNFVPANEWRKLSADDVLKSVEIAVKVIKDEITSEWLGEGAEIGRVAQLLDLSAVFQDLAMSVLKGIAEGHEHL